MLRPRYKLCNFSLTTFLASLFIIACYIPPSLAQDDEDDDFFIFDEEESSSEISDPLEPFNRTMFSFNDKIYRGLLKPVAVAFRVVPEPVRVSISNVIDNLQTPISAINGALQLDIPNAGTEFSRFIINSSIGVLGLFDPATNMGIAKDNEDLGQTLGHYGIGHGLYLVIPFFGSSSLRDGVALVGENQIDPFFQHWDPDTIDNVGYRLVDAETALSLDQDTYEAFYDSALDPYIFFRSAYTQNRAGKIEQ